MYWTMILKVKSSYIVFSLKNRLWSDAKEMGIFFKEQTPVFNEIPYETAFLAEK